MELAEHRHPPPTNATDSVLQSSPEMAGSPAEIIGGLMPGLMSGEMATGTEQNGIILDEIQQQQSGNHQTVQQQQTNRNGAAMTATNSKSWVKLNVGGKVFVIKENNFYLHWHF